MLCTGGYAAEGDEGVGESAGIVVLQIGIKYVEEVVEVNVAEDQIINVG